MTVSRRLLAGLAASQLLVALDFSVVYVAVPTIGADLRFSSVTVQWVVSAYGVFFAGFLLLGGRLVDVVGPAPVFVCSHLLFSGAAFAAGFAPDAAVLIVLRAAQGVGAALLAPSTLALLHSRYRAGPERDRALAVWGTTGAMGLALGVVAGGVLLSVASWRWIFWLNLPVSLICLSLARVSLRTARASVGRRVDAPVAMLATALVCALVAAFTEAATPAPHWELVLAAAVGSVVLGAVVVRSERAARDPLLPLAALRSPSLRAASVLAALFMASMGAEFYLVTLFLQQELAMSVLDAGLGFLPLALTIAAGNALAGRLAGRWTPRTVLVVAFAIGALGLAMLAVGTQSDSYWRDVVPGLLVSGFGQGLAFVAIFIAGTRELSQDAEGSGSSVITAAQYIGGALGLAVLVWVHGQHPDAVDIGRAYWVTAAVALAAVPLNRRMLRTSSSRREPG